jgi:hypothetical protein
MSSVLAATPRSRLRMGSEEAGGALCADDGCCGRSEGWKPAEGEGGARRLGGRGDAEARCSCSGGRVLPGVEEGVQASAPAPGEGEERARASASVPSAGGVATRE